MMNIKIEDLIKKYVFYQTEKMESFPFIKEGNRELIEDVIFGIVKEYFKDSDENIDDLSIGYFSYKQNYMCSNTEYTTKKIMRLFNLFLYKEFDITQNPLLLWTEVNEKITTKIRDYNINQLLKD
tara:strand:+ start:160992 stop:161366 length:375 start_codon:yes stop_codon:yes gene_type:complete